MSFLSGHNGKPSKDRRRDSSGCWQLNSLREESGLDWEVGSGKEVNSFERKRLVLAGPNGLAGERERALSSCQKAMCSENNVP